MSEILYAEESYAIMGAAMAVHKALGCGFAEKVYQEALAIEFEARGIPFEKEKQLHIAYRGQQLKQDYFADFVCYGKIIIELKALHTLQNEHQAQVMNYLRCAQMKLGILLNFGTIALDYKRIVWG